MGYCFYTKRCVQYDPITMKKTNQPKETMTKTYNNIQDVSLKNLYKMLTLKQFQDKDHQKMIKDEIHIKGPQKIKKISHLATKEYGGFPTDLAPQFMVLLCKANGRSSITENIFLPIAFLSRSASPFEKSAIF